MRKATTDKREQPDPYPKGGDLYPSQWLQTAMAHMRRGQHDMYLDTSVMNELALSQSHLENRRARAQGQEPPWTFNVQFNPVTRQAFKDAEVDGGEFAEKFTAFFRQSPELHRRTLYGSDWHMPNVSAVSGHDGFMRLVEAAIPAENNMRANVMGMNAARFYGLRKGNANRKRIDAFLAGAGVNLDTVRWMRKLDRTS